MGLYCFIHVCCVPKGIEVLEIQLNLIKKTGLYDKLDKIYLGLLGDYDTFLRSKLYTSWDKTQAIYFSRNKEEMEFPTLSELKNFSDSEESNHKILYIHTKGVRYPNSLQHREWREYMEYFLIERHHICINDLDNYTTVGVNYHIKPWKHYSGNFWWANSHHIKKLVHPDALPRSGNKYTEGGRWNAEKWLLTYIKPDCTNKLTILEGKYGLLNTNNILDITNLLIDRVKDNRLYIKKTENIHTIFGNDPAYRKPKQLFVKYILGSKEQSLIIDEYATKLKRDLLIDGGNELKIKCYHESGIHHYNYNYPRYKYEIKENIITDILKDEIPSDMMTYWEIHGVLTHLKDVLDKGIEGDIVELGCNVGTTSIFIRKLLNKYKSNKQFHVYDSWNGLPKKHSKDESNTYRKYKEGLCKVSKSQFINNFNKYNLELPIIHSGWFKDIHDDEYPKKICFAFFDGDFYTSIIDSFEKTYDKIQHGGKIVVDDCGWDVLPGVLLACNEFLENKKEKITLDGYPDSNGVYGPKSKGGLIIKL